MKTLTEVIKESGLKKYKIAETLGITRRQLRNIETGKAGLDKLKAEKLSQIFNMGVSEIETLKRM